MIKFLLVSTIFIVFINCLKYEYGLINNKDDDSSWANKPWIYYVGMFLSVTVSILESIGGTIIKKSHIVYAKYKKLVERKDSSSKSLDVKNDTTNFNQNFVAIKDSMHSLLCNPLSNISNSKMSYKENAKINAFTCLKLCKKNKKKKKTKEKNNREIQNVKEINDFMEQEFNNKNSKKNNNLETSYNIYNKSSGQLNEIHNIQTLYNKKIYQLKDISDKEHDINNSIHSLDTSINDDINPIYFNKEGKKTIKNNSRYKSVHNKNLTCRETDEEVVKKENFHMDKRFSCFTLAKKKKFDFFNIKNKEMYCPYNSNYSHKKNKFNNCIKEYKNYNNTFTYNKKKSITYSIPFKNFYSMQNLNSEETFASNIMLFEGKEQHNNYYNRMCGISCIHKKKKNNK